MRLILILLIISFSFAKKPEEMNLIELFKNNYYSYICMHRWRYINKYQGKDEKLLSIVAYSCLKKNYLTPALDLSKVLRYTKEGRNNGLYINELFMIKLLLIRYIMDNYDISSIHIPQIEDNLLGKIFNLVKLEKPAVNNNSFIVSDKNKKYLIEYVISANTINITIFENNKLIKKVKYW